MRQERVVAGWSQQRCSTKKVTEFGFLGKQVWGCSGGFTSVEDNSNLNLLSKKSVELLFSSCLKKIVVLTKQCPQTDEHKSVSTPFIKIQRIKVCIKYVILMNSYTELIENCYRTIIKQIFSPGTKEKYFLKGQNIHSKISTTKQFYFCFFILFLILQKCSTISK